LVIGSRELFKYLSSKWFIMKEVVLRLEVPEDLKEIAEISEAEISLAVNRLLKKKLLEISEIEMILSKSKLSEEKAREIAKEISLSLSKEYEKLYKELEG